MAAIPIFSDAFARVSTSPGVRRAAILGALLVFGLAWGAAVAFAGVAAALICVSLVACVFCLRDFRSGVVLLILIMPISASFIFPHSMFGIAVTDMEVVDLGPTIPLTYDCVRNP